MRHTPLLATMALTAMGAHSLAAQTMRSVATSRPLSGERMLRASIEFGAGTVHVGPAASGDLYRMQLRYDADRNGPVNQFDAATGAVRLGLQGNGNAGIRVASTGGKQEWQMKRDLMSQRFTTKWNELLEVI